ncbi:YbfB/YjiJ family MFS transporter [Pseudomonas otitidis]|uniref:YbfB/YjiJ family MFS transporter n=1 Tax=Metapseudomonas otitidis TaxID=319939 RepID=UPI0024ADD1B1|nr:YbfB/YjiJ family MFS transporter [Pseudomonas otitidis]MDI6524838.1 YbfB/YjiJ family MFS transporter [Pseudomonas otitidis]
MAPSIRILASLLALIAAMGIGRFALTPQLPHLIAEGQVDLTAAGLVAAANYLGYLVGALDALRATTAQHARRRLFGGLWVGVAITLASAWAEGFWAHALLRFAAGVTSAWVLVVVTGLAAQVAADAGRPRLGGLIFTGPSLGVILTGLIALGLNLQGAGSAQAWLAFGSVALVLAAIAHPLLPRPRAASATGAMQAGPRPAAFYPLLVAYSLVGMGYILPATFLSQMAASQFHGHWQADLFWPAFGLVATLGVLLVSLRRPGMGSTGRWLVGALWLQALGVLACLFPGMTGLALGVVLCGAPFLASMLLVMQRAREIDPQGHARNVGLLTAGFALGQLSGPLLAALSSHFSGGLRPALLLAAGALLLAGGLMLKAREAVKVNGVATCRG